MMRYLNLQMKMLLKQQNYLLKKKDFLLVFLLEQRCMAQ